MDGILHFLGVTAALGFVAVCLFGFVRGLSLSPNEHRVQGQKPDYWST